MSWATPLTSESDLIDLFRELGQPDRQRLIKYAWNLAHPDHFFGGPLHGSPIDEMHWRGDDDPQRIQVAYDESRHAIYERGDGLGIYVFKALVPIDTMGMEKGGAA